MQPTSRRKLSNLVIDPASLLRLSIPFLVMVAGSLGIVIAIRWEIMQALQRTQLQGIENLATINSLYQLQATITEIGTVGLGAMALICLGLWMFYSHRVFGPTVPMRRHVQALIDGDFSSRLQLRRGDEFHSLSEELNRLAEVLEQKSRPEG